jgi:hypothetical protein
MKRCPAALKYGYLMNLKGPFVRAMERGSLIHSLAEHYLKGTITGGVPPQLIKLKKEFVALKAEHPIVEKYWGVSRRWEPMEYGWCTAKTDAAVEPTKKLPILDIVDHKSGREYPDHEHQGSLYAAVGFALYPKIEGANATFFYVDQGTAPTFEFTRPQLVYAVKYWREEGLALMSMKKFLPTPSPDACRFCNYRSDKKLADGKPGPCEAWKITGSGGNRGRW